MASCTLLGSVSLGTTALSFAWVYPLCHLADEFNNLWVFTRRTARSHPDFCSAQQLTHFTALFGQAEGNDVTLRAGASRAA